MQEGLGETECLVDIGLTFSGHAFKHACKCAHVHAHTQMTSNLVGCAKVWPPREHNNAYTTDHTKTINYCMT